MRAAYNGFKNWWKSGKNRGDLLGQEQLFFMGFGQVCTPLCSLDG
jgi:hypothetical protein